MKICLFSSFSESPKIDNYIKYYLIELKKYFDEIVFITNHRNLDNDAVDFLSQNIITLKIVQNKGYDFGMYYHVIKNLDVTQCDMLGLVNDSCYLFKPLVSFFKWYEMQQLDCAGFTDSVYNNHHIQSYFLLFSKRVLSYVKNYFVTNGIIENVHELIKTYEIGLCKNLTSSGYTIGSMFCQKDFKNNQSNIMTEEVVSLLNTGIPLIKKKLLLNTFREDELSYLEHVKFDFSINYRQLLVNYADNDVLKYLLSQQTVKVYQIYYDESHLNSLSHDTLPYYNNYLTEYFENDIIRKAYENGLMNSDYFGVLSWRFLQKTGFQFKNTMITGDADIYAFQNSTRNHSVFGDSAMCHPLFMDIFSKVLELLNCQNINPTLGLYMNYIVAKTPIFKKYVEEFLIPTIDYLKTLPDHDKVWADACYHHNPTLTQKLQQFIGKPYYTYHTFICERLWSVFYEKYKNRYSLKIINGQENFDLSMPVKQILKKPEAVVQQIRVEDKKMITKDLAICVSHLSDRSNLEKINNENKIYDLYLTGFDSIDISKWHSQFKKQEIISVRSVPVVPSALDKPTYQNVYMCSVANQLWQNEEQIIRNRYKIVVYSNTLMILSAIIDIQKMMIQSNTIYVKKSPHKYWFAKADVMRVFSNIFKDVKDYTGSFDDVIVKFALKRNIKIIEI